MHAKIHADVILQLNNLSWQLCIAEKKISHLITVFLIWYTKPHYSNLLVIIFEEIAQYIFSFTCLKDRNKWFYMRQMAK